MFEVEGSLRPHEKNKHVVKLFAQMLISNRLQLVCGNLLVSLGCLLKEKNI